LVTRSLTELVSARRCHDGNANAFYGLSGAGDLVLTCYSERKPQSHRRQRLGAAKPLAQITASMKTVVEGIPTARSAWECATAVEYLTPIIDEVYAVLYEQKKTDGCPGRVARPRTKKPNNFSAAIDNLDCAPRRNHRPGPA